jgi:hypothetical protein
VVLKHSSISIKEYYAYRKERGGADERVLLQGNGGMFISEIVTESV